MTGLQPYDIVPSDATGGTFDAAKYAITYHNGQLTIGKAQLTVAADDHAVTYGDATPALTYTVSGFVAGEGAGVLSGDPVLTTTYEAGTPVSASPLAVEITAGTLAADNYTFSFVDGAITIVPMVKLVNLSGRVFDDRNNDGVFDPEDGDTHLVGVVIELVDESTGEIVDTATSGADDGRYHFTGVPFGTYKVDAQVMAVALATFLTKSSLAGLVYGDVAVIDQGLIATVESYGFTVTAGGVGSTWFNVGSSGEAFGVEDDTEVQIIDLLLATDSMSFDGLLYDIDGDGEISGWENLLRTLANDVYSRINELGGR